MTGVRLVLPHVRCREGGKLSSNIEDFRIEQHD